MRCRGHAGEPDGLWLVTPAGQRRIGWTGVRGLVVIVRRAAVPRRSTDLDPSECQAPGPRAGVPLPSSLRDPDKMSRSESFRLRNELSGHAVLYNAFLAPSVCSSRLYDTIA